MCEYLGVHCFGKGWLNTCWVGCHSKLRLLLLWTKLKTGLLGGSLLDKHAIHYPFKGGGCVSKWRRYR